MPIPIPDFESEFIKAIRQNLTEVINQLDKKDRGLLKKINTFATRFNFDQIKIEKKIRDDEVFRAIFAKDPGKQKIHENIAAAFIEKIPGLKNFKQLSHGKLQLISGAVFSKRAVREMGATTQAKTIDFSWSTNTSQMYASHKYTKSSGGAQDNQYRDLKDFIREANNSNLPNTIFLAIADGGYYDLNDSESNVSKIQRLKDLSNRRNVFALRISELEGFLEDK